jgi:hypothetical protein
LDVTDLNVTFVLDVVVCCCLLHNLLLGQASEEVACLIEILQRDGMIEEVDDDPVVDPAHGAARPIDFQRADLKRTELGMYLGWRQNLVD